MPTMKDADGKDIEVFTAEEVEAQKAATLAEYQKEHPDQAAELTKLQTDLKTATEALDIAKKGGGDATELALQVKALTDKTEEAIKIANAARDVPTQTFKEDLLGILAQSDASLKEKVQIHYKALSGMPEGTKAEVRSRMDAALKLASDTVSPTIFDGGVGRMGARGDGSGSKSSSDETENGKGIRMLLGITDEQATKYAPKPGQPGYKAS